MQAYVVLNVGYSQKVHGNDTMNVFSLDFITSQSTDSYDRRVYSISVKCFMRWLDLILKKMMSIVYPVHMFMCECFSIMTHLKCWIGQTFWMYFIHAILADCFYSERVEIFESCTKTAAFYLSCGGGKNLYSWSSVITREVNTTINMKDIDTIHVFESSLLKLLFRGRFSDLGAFGLGFHFCHKQCNMHH